MEDLKVNPVFQALMRPPMMLGVTVDYLMLNIISVMILFMQTKQVALLLLVLPIHIVGWIICKIDPFIFRVLLKKIDFIASPNQKIWGCKSYAPY